MWVYIYNIQLGSAKRQRTSSSSSSSSLAAAPIFSSTRCINNVPVEVWKEHFCQKFLKIDPLSSSLPVPHVLQITVQYIIVGTGLYLYINTSEDTTAENAIKPATEADPRTAPFNSNSNDDSFGDRGQCLEGTEDRPLKGKGSVFDYCYILFFFIRWDV